MNRRSLLSFTLVAATGLVATAALAQTAVTGGSSRPRPVPRADALGPRSTDSTVAESVARSQIEHDGYSGVRDLIRTSDGGWQGVALSRENKPVVVAVDAHGKLTEVR
ncbi:MAG TPA: hypothetical protein VFB13_15230 [Reyranella sp.]|jgi:hypothetical protein|nr:hypothetical protein [Reyranella sp.]